MEYINNLSFKQLQAILNKCGLFVVDNEEKFNDTKSEEKKHGDLECYYFRAIDCRPDKNKNIVKNNFMKEIFNSISYENFELDKSFLNMSYSNGGVDIFSVSDFMLCRAFPIETFGNEFPNNRDLELQEKFVSVMSSTFKNQGYSQRYNDFADKIISNVDDEITHENA